MGIQDEEMAKMIRGNFMRKTTKRSLFILALLLCFQSSVNADEIRKLPTEADGLAVEASGDWKKAIAIYDDILKRNPDQLSLWLRVANLNWSTNNAAKTAEALTQVVRLKKDDPELYLWLSQAYSMLQKPAPALAALDRAVELNPKKIEYWQARGQSANWLGRYDVAEESFQKVIELSPGNWDAILNLARTQKWAGRLTQSVGNYRAYVETFPNKKEIIIEFAAAEAERGNYPAAEKILQDYQSRFGADNASTAYLARIYAWDDRPDGSFSLLNPLLKAKPEDYDLLYTKTVDLRYALRFPEALESLKQLEKLRPNTKEVFDTKRFIRTPVRHNIMGGFNFYSDTDRINIVHGETKGTYFLTPLTSLFARAEYDYVTARQGSGLEDLSGKSDAQRSAASLGVSHQFSPLLGVTAFGGAAFANSRTSPYYGVDLSIRPHDDLKLHLIHSYDYYLPSVRALSLGIRRYQNTASFEWRPDLLWTVGGSASLNFFSRGNREWDVQLFPRRAVMRNEYLNLDLGISAQRQGFSVQDAGTGYYSPVLYEKYMVSGLWYLKITDDDGISFTTGVGVNKDTTMSTFKAAYEGSIEGNFGIYRDLYLRINLGGLHSLGQTGAYTGWSTGMSITYRF